MTTKAKMFLAKLLIVFSVVLIFGGTVLQFGEKRVLHPQDDVTVLAGVEKEIISVTTVDDDDVIVPITGTDALITTLPEVIPPIDSGSNNNEVNNNNGVSGNGNSNSVDHSGNNSNVNSGSSGSDSNSGGNATGGDNSEVEQTPSNPVPVTPTIEEANAQLRSAIESTYGITVKYGSETLGYSVGGMSTEAILDSATCQAALNNLNKALSLYPTGFFREIANKGYPLTFYLIKRYSTNNVTGVTDSSYNNVVISIATDYDFADTFHHEVYHYIERYIFSTGFRFTSWDLLNPSGFIYGTVNPSFSYTKTYAQDAFFVNNYAQTDQYEDRASTFEYMMKSSKASCLNYGNTVWLKAKTMSEQIDYFLNTVSPNVTEYWERYIY